MSKQSKAPTKRQIKLPRNVYEALYYSSLEFGGIGGGRYVDWVTSPPAPVCIYGQVGIGSSLGVALLHLNDTTFCGKRFNQYLYEAGLTVNRNDSAVRAINQRKGASEYARVTFEEYVKELNIVPDDSDAGYGELFDIAVQEQFADIANGRDEAPHV